MAPGAHLLISWLTSIEMFKERRERILVTISGVIPDADGFGIVIDKITGNTSYYFDYHHHLGHNVFAATIVSLAALILAKSRKFLTFLFSLLLFHVHILCDIVGSMGPDGYQWPIYYLYPFNDEIALKWSGQWELSAWQNQTILAGCFVLCIFYAHARQVTFFEIFGERFNSTALKMFNKLARKNA